MPKSQEYSKDIYPEDFSDEDKYNFDTLLSQELTIYPDIEVWIMKLAIIAHINKMNGNGVPLDQEEVIKLREKGLDIKPIYETPENNILSFEWINDAKFKSAG